MKELSYRTTNILARNGLTKKAGAARVPDVDALRNIAECGSLRALRGVGANTEREILDFLDMGKKAISRENAPPAREPENEGQKIQYESIEDVRKMLRRAEIIIDDLKENRQALEEFIDRKGLRREYEAQRRIIRRVP